MTEEQLLELEISAAWESFCDGDANLSTERIKALDPNFYRLLALSFSRGYVAGAANTLRSIENERS